MSHLKQWQERVVEDKKQLDKDIEKLERFMDGDVFKGIDSRAEKDRIRYQLQVMRLQSRIMADRIEYFESIE